VSSHLDSVFRVGVQAVQLELTSDHLSHVVAIGSSACTTAANVWSQVVDLLTVLIANHGATGGSGVCRKDDSFIEDSTTNGGSRGHGSIISSQALASVRRESLVPDAVIVVEATSLG